MKLDKKTIIIIIVAAVAAFILWKKGVFSRAKNSVVDTGASGSGDIDLDYIFSHVVTKSDVRSKIESLKKNLETNLSFRQQIQAEAYQNGVSFDQQVAITGAYLYYYQNNSWITNGWKDYQAYKKAVMEL